MNDLIISIVRGVLAFVLAWASVTIINLTSSIVLNLVFPGVVSVSGAPLTNVERWTDLGLLSLAGTIGVIVIVLAARRAVWSHAVIFGASAAVIDIIACFTILSDQPWWYKLIMLTTLPLQIFFGAIIGTRIRGRRW